MFQILKVQVPALLPISYLRPSIHSFIDSTNQASIADEAQFRCWGFGGEEDKTSPLTVLTF